MKDAARLLSFMSTQGEKERSKETSVPFLQKALYTSIHLYSYYFQLPIPFPFSLLLLIRCSPSSSSFLIADGFVVGAVLFCHLILWNKPQRMTWQRIGEKKALLTSPIATPKRISLNYGSRLCVLGETE